MVSTSEPGWSKIPDAGPHGGKGDLLLTFGNQDNADFRILEVEETGEPDGVIHLQTGPKQDDFDGVSAEYPEQVVGTRGEVVGRDRVEGAVQSGGRLPTRAFKLLDLR